MSRDERYTRHGVLKRGIYSKVIRMGNIQACGLKLTDGGKALTRPYIMAH